MSYPQPNDDVTPSNSDASVFASSAEEDFGALLDAWFAKEQPERGDIVQGKIVAVDPQGLVIAIDGLRRDGIVQRRDLERMGVDTAHFTVGSEIEVMILRMEDEDGNPILSVSQAQQTEDWKKAEELMTQDQIWEGIISKAHRSGLIVRFGRLRGFVPQSQMSAERRRVLEGDANEEQWSKMVNESIFIKVVEVDRQRNRLILSERLASRETRERRKESLIHQLTVGEIRTGHVVSLEDFGAFVDIGGAEGLVHLTELSWHHVTHPREVLQVGEEVKVEVIAIDPVAKRIGLSIRRQAPDPWDTIVLGYQVGQLVKGKVTKLTQFGAFAKIVDVPEIEGLIHISELSDKRVQHPREAVKEGDMLTLRIVKIDVKNRRLALSLKRVSPEEIAEWQQLKQDEASSPSQVDMSSELARQLEAELTSFLSTSRLRVSEEWLQHRVLLDFYVFRLDQFYVSLSCINHVTRGTPEYIGVRDEATLLEIVDNLIAMYPTQCHSILRKELSSFLARIERGDYLSVEEELSRKQTELGSYLAGSEKPHRSVYASKQTESEVEIAAIRNEESVGKSDVT